MNNRGQIWVETVIYTLIGLALIGLVLAILTPKVKEFRDRSVIEQTIETLNLLDSKITEVLDAPGNKRKINFRLEKGNLEIDSLGNKINYFIEDSDVRYSEPGIQLNIGRINVLTEELTETYKITLSMNYVYNITYDGKDANGEFTPASVPYEIFVENRGVVNGKQWIDITEGT